MHTNMHTAERTTRGRGSRLLAVGAAAALLLGYGATTAQAQAEEPPYDRGVTGACDDGAMEADAFDDVHLGMAHSGAIDCLWVYNIVRGQFVDGQSVFQPGDTVTRQQMATFIAGALQQIPARHLDLPDVDEDAVPPFDDGDQVSTAHRRSVTLLTELGVVQGYGDDTFRPGELVNRAQMATFVVNAIETVTGEELDRAEVFVDVAGEHQASVEKLAAAGIVQGREDGTYGPAASTTRAQMATYIARSLDLLVEQHYLHPIAYRSGDDAARLGLTDVEFGQHELHERITFTLEGDDRFAGWRVDYVDEAIAHGSGQEVEVEGDEILRVILTGMALPPDLDEDVQEHLWDDSPLVTEGALITEVVDVGVYEGQHLLFVGLSDRYAFGVDRLDDPQRVYLDVFDLE